MVPEPDHQHPVDPERVAAAQAALLSVDEAEEFNRLLTVLSDPVRVRILSALLAVEELCVGDLALALDVSEDAVSYALRVLRAQRLVRRRAEGRMGYYRLADGDIRPVLVAALGDLRALARRRAEPSSQGRPAP